MESCIFLYYPGKYVGEFIHFAGAVKELGSVYYDYSKPYLTGPFEIYKSFKVRIS
jgi:hypothetical protein